MCTESEGYCGFTVKDRYTLFKTKGFRMGLHNNAGFTYVLLTNGGRDVLLDTIRRTRGGQRKAFVDPIRDLDVILSAVEEDPSVFKFVCDDLRCNAQVVWIAVQANGLALQYASDDQKANHDIV